jgi:threonyl-tRNA synthetase
MGGACAEYALQVRKACRAGGFHVDCDQSDRKMQKKVREAQLSQYNYILVVGEEEAKNGTVNVRTRDNHVHGMHSIASFLAKLAEEKGERSLTSAFVSPEAPAADAPAAPQA